VKLLNATKTSSQIANASGYVSENPGLFVDDAQVDFLLKIPTPSMSRRAMKLLSFLSKRLPTPGKYLHLPFEHTHMSNFIEHIQDFRAQDIREEMEFAKELLPFMAAAWAENVDELQYIIEEYLTEAGFLKYDPGSGRGFLITPKGWEFLEHGGDKTIVSDTAFVAMWFDIGVESLWVDALRPGILDAQFEPVRIDKVDHNNKIDDEIIAQIRRSKFLVADFTGQRGGVYFEAGFALGLGIPVIWVCREDELKDVHFDTRQYNFLEWRSSELSTLRKALTARIEATIGRGSYNQIDQRR